MMLYDGSTDTNIMLSVPDLNESQIFRSSSSFIDLESRGIYHSFSLSCLELLSDAGFVVSDWNQKCRCLCYLSFVVSVKRMRSMPRNARSLSRKIHFLAALYFCER